MSAQDVANIYEADKARLHRDRRKNTLAKQGALRPRATQSVENMTVKWEPASLAANLEASKAAAALGLRVAETAAAADMIIVSELKDWACAKNYPELEPRRLHPPDCWLTHVLYESCCPPLRLLLLTMLRVRHSGLAGWSG